MKLIKESLNNFHKTGDIKKELNIGMEAVKSEIRRKIIDETELVEKLKRIGVKVDSAIPFNEQNLDPLWINSIILNNFVFGSICLSIIEKGDESEIAAIREILDKELLVIPKLEVRNGKLIDSLFKLGIFKEKYIDIRSNFSYILREHREFALEYLDKKGPNSYVSAGIEIWSPELIKIGALKGATNLNIGSNAAINLAADKNDIELVKILLSKPEVDPTENTKEGKRYKNDETNYPIRTAAKNGFYELTKLLLADPRVSPSAKSNFALKHSFSNGHFDVAQLLLSDPRVIRDFYLLPKTTQMAIKKKLGIGESLSERKGSIIFGSLFEGTGENLDIVKSFEAKEELCPEIFEEIEGSYIMIDDVREKLLEISNRFLDFIGIEIEAEDIYLTGSLANYNWSDYSDVDLHILVDFSQFDAEPEILAELFDAKRYSWNLSRKITIKGFDVELYIQNIEESHTSSGVYSIETNEWVVEPISEPHEIDQELILSKAENYMRAIDKLVDAEESGEDVSEEEDDLKRKLKKFRQGGLERGGEFSYENLVFKLLRRNSYIEKLFSSRKRIEDKRLSIER